MFRIVLAENIKNIRKALDMTQEELALKAGYSDKSMICKIESKETFPPLERIVAIANALDVRPEVLLGWGSDTMNDEGALSGIAIPVYSSVPSDRPRELKSFIVSYEQIPSSCVGKHFALRIPDNSMAPTFFAGDTVIIKKQEAAENGSLVLALFEGKNASLHRLLKTKNDQFLLPPGLKSATKQLKEESRYLSDYRILGKVVEIRRKC